jgi:hypothetical protein
VRRARNRREFDVLRSVRSVDLVGIVQPASDKIRLSTVRRRRDIELRRRGRRIQRDRDEFDRFDGFDVDIDRIFINDVVDALRRAGIERSQSEQRVDSGDDRRSELGVRSHRR